MIVISFAYYFKLDVICSFFYICSFLLIEMTFNPFLLFSHKISWMMIIMIMFYSIQANKHKGFLPPRVWINLHNHQKAYDEMTKLIQKAQNNASAYEKRSEYCERELTKADLEMVTRLDPLRVYPYRYRAAGQYSIPSF